MRSSSSGSLKDGELRANASETAFDLLLGEFRAEIGPAHGVDCAVQLARSIEMLMVGSERRADRAAGIARRRLDPDALEGSIAQYFAVGHAIERDAAGKTEIVDSVSLRQRARDAQHDLLSDLLHRGGEIHITLRERRTPDRVAVHQRGRETSATSWSVPSHS